MTTSTSPQEDSGVLSEVEIETHQGSKYVFPDMKWESLAFALPPSGRVPESMSVLTLCNYSGACLTLPFRIVKEVRVGKAILWSSPV